MLQELADQMKNRLYQKRLLNKNWRWLKTDFASETNFDEPAWAELAKTFDQRNEADFRNLTLPKMDFAGEKNLRQSDLTERLAK